MLPPWRKQVTPFNMIITPVRLNLAVLESASIMWLFVLALPAHFIVCLALVQNASRSIVKRVHYFEGECTEDQENVLNDVFNHYVEPMALRAAGAANPDPDDPEVDYYGLKFLEYFATWDRPTRTEIFKRFAMIHWEARVEYGRIGIYCTDRSFREDSGIPEEDQPCENHPGQSDKVHASSNIRVNFIVLVYLLLFEYVT